MVTISDVAWAALVIGTVIGLGTFLVMLLETIIYWWRGEL